MMRLSSFHKEQSATENSLGISFGQFIGTGLVQGWYRVVLDYRGWIFCPIEQSQCMRNPLHVIFLQISYYQ